jgi:hypothetical protein
VRANGEDTIDAAAGESIVADEGFASLSIQHHNDTEKGGKVERPDNDR